MRGPASGAGDRRSNLREHDPPNVDLIQVHRQRQLKSTWNIGTTELDCESTAGRNGPGPLATPP